MRNRSALLALGIFMTACGTPVVESLPTSPTSSPTEVAPSAGTPDLADQFEVADGRSLYVECRGEGSPTVILEAGDGSGREEWPRVEPAISAVSQTCAYDRGGIGRSDPVSGCRQLSDLTDDLANLLEAAEIPGPYVLVAGSGGGFIAAGFATQHPEDIAGMVFVDVPEAFQDPPPEVVEETACDHPENVERRDYLQVEADAWDNRTEIGDIPVTIISVDFGPDDPETANNVEAQEGWLVLSPRATQVVVETGHDVANEDPALVIEEVTKVIEAARE